MDDESKGLPPTTRRTSTPTRGDIARFVLLTLKADMKNKFEPYFVGTDVHYKEDTIEVLKKRWPLLYNKGMGHDIKGRDGLISLEKSKRELGYEPIYSWTNELKD